MNKKPLVTIFFAAVMFCMTSADAQTGTGKPNPEGSQTVAGDKASARNLPDDRNLPQSASALPLLSTVGAGALLVGLLSARRTRTK